MANRENIRWVCAGLLAASITAQWAVACRRDRSEVPTRHGLRAEIAAPAEAVGEVALDSRERLSELLVDAIVQVESAGCAHQTGRHGERGLMQIKRATWREVTHRLFGSPVSFEEAFDADLNRQVGKAYLAEIQRFLQEHRTAWKADERSLLLACYNAGPVRVRQSGFDLHRLPTTTRSYVERASALHDFYLADQAPDLQRVLLSQLRAGSQSG